MSQNDFSIANADGATVRADVNAALQALASRSSGATEPSTAYAYQIWVDTTSGTVKRRNAANSAWIIESTLDEARAVSRSSNTILDESDIGKFFTATATFTQTLTAAATLGDGWYCWYRVNEGASVIFDPNSSELIDGAATLSLSGPAIVLIWCTGAAFTTAVIRRGARTAPQMDYGGYQFDGSTDYLNGNALTGITDTKTFTFACVCRFANAASATDVLFSNTGVQFDVRRTAAGKIQVLAENSGGTGILNISTTATVCSAAGTYVILISGDLATAGSARIYVNDIAQAITETTFTNDTIDFTVADNAIGGTVAGASLTTGDIYLMYLNELVNLEFNTESVRRKFADVNNVPVWMGRNGELPTGSAPILFHAYDTYTAWPRQRGRASTTWVENGTPGAVGTALSGQYGDAQTRILTVTADYTVARNDRYIINNRAATNTLTLESATSVKGKVLNVSTLQAQTVVSASSNVVPKTGGAAGTAILAASAGAWAKLVSDGTNWLIVAAG